MRVSASSVGKLRRGLIDERFVGDDPVEEPRADALVVARRRRRRSLGTPAPPRNASVGPLSTSPPTTGLTATTGARTSASARRSRSRIGPIEITGLLGPTITARACASAASTSRRRRGGAPPPRRCRKRHLVHRPAAALADQELLQRASRRRRCGRALVAHRQHRSASRRSRPQSSRSAAVGVMPSSSIRRALQAPREVAVAELEPDVDPERAQRLHDREAVAAQAPAALVDAVGEPEGDRGRGRGRRARRRSRCHRRCWRSPTSSLRADDVEHAARELCAAGPAGEHDDLASARCCAATPTARRARA